MSAEYFLIIYKLYKMHFIWQIAVKRLRNSVQNSVATSNSAVTAKVGHRAQVGYRDHRCPIETWPAQETTASVLHLPTMAES